MAVMAKSVMTRTFSRVIFRVMLFRVKPCHFPCHVMHNTMLLAITGHQTFRRCLHPALVPKIRHSNNSKNETNETPSTNPIAPPTSDKYLDNP